MLTAKDILESPVFADAVERVREQLLEEFERTPPDEAEALQDVAYRRQALAIVLGELRREVHVPSINLKGKAK